MGKLVRRRPTAILASQRLVVSNLAYRSDEEGHVRQVGQDVENVLSLALVFLVLFLFLVVACEYD